MTKVLGSIIKNQNVTLNPKKVKVYKKVVLSRG